MKLNILLQANVPHGARLGVGAGAGIWGEMSGAFCEYFRHEDIILAIGACSDLPSHERQV